MADPQLPRVQAAMLDGGGFASREWYDFFRDLVAVASQGSDQEAQILALQAAVQALEDAGGNTATLLGPASVGISGTLAGGSVTFRLINDLASPGNTYRYGTGPTGIKGWHAVADDFLEGTGIEFTVGSDGVVTIALDAATIASLALADSALQSVVAGTNITVDNTDPQNPIISASGGGGGGGTVDTVVAGTGIDVDATDPANPIVSLDSATVASLALADSALQTAVLSVVAGTGVTVDATDPENPIVNATGSSTPLAPADVWSDYYFTHTNVVAGPWIGAAVVSGTNTATITAASMDGLFPFGVFLRSSTSANGGYRYGGGNVVSVYFGSNTHKFQCTFKWMTSFTGRTVRMGMQDTTTIADNADGAYFEIVAGTVSAKTANNSTRTTDPTTYALTLNTAYTFDIEVEASGASARYRIYDGNNTTAVYDETITTNIPTTTSRAFGVGIVATESSTTASDIGILYRMAYGNVAGFNRARG